MTTALGTIPMGVATSLICVMLGLPLGILV